MYVCVEINKNKLIVFILNFLGWCLVWKLYLSKFKLVKELFSQQAPEIDSSSKTQKTF